MKHWCTTNESDLDFPGTIQTTFLRLILGASQIMQLMKQDIEEDRRNVNKAGVQLRFQLKKIFHEKHNARIAKYACSEVKTVVEFQKNIQKISQAFQEVLRFLKKPGLQIAQKLK